MNRFRVLRVAAGKDMDVVANAAGIDVVQLALFERHMGHIHVSVAYRLADIIETPLGDVFPLLRGTFLAAEAVDDADERKAVIFDPSVRTHLVESGIDAEHLPWFAVLILKSGNERRYHLTSMEYARVRLSLLETETSEGFITFHADCQSVIIRKKAIASVRFSNDASYAYFASHERAYVVTIVSDASPRPVRVEVTPDGDEDGTGPRPFAELFRTAMAGSDSMPPFLSLLDSPGETVVSLDGIEAIEIPIGVTMPEIYDDGTTSHADPVSQEERISPKQLH